ncbi:MAG: bifunctional phosphopantothenoylcysteine decarboxylase/phosphopantothenate--cysteine ligase CoaBC [Bacteroidales bacterium]|nr:bifunctional phosphopantothenoylcysteine decarboxylase/phosphopantothenate--cysteine ligase CoaBC [Bacteroidales bacterium]MBR1850667.1 bifunctional phosphopantothenoylcysteine decarboxylase/phosphopantothenate--cysteine ligase CoaBC [Bacteroidales bacterium]
MNIVVGASGGIAAYKTPEMVRMLVKQGHSVRCAVTQSALQFVTRATLETVSSHPLYSDLFEGNAHATEHISIKDWADMLLVAPATADILAKAASGIADDALSTLIAATHPSKLYLAPAMNTDMWHHPAVQRNVASLREWGATIIGPGNGALACGANGDGRMADPDLIVSAILADTARPLQGQMWLVTAGPTYERIDPVRFIGNFSSGKMGFALAQALAEQGAQVELIAGPTHLATPCANIHRTDVESATQMFDAAISIFPNCNGAILAAAVADYRPETCQTNKIKKQGGQGMSLQLTPNPDILAHLGATKKTQQTLVGFALETDHELDNAKQKLQRKNLDFIIMNSLRDSGAGFQTDTNKVTIISRNGTETALPLMNKLQTARKIVNSIV